MPHLLERLALLQPFLFPSSFHLLHQEAALVSLLAQAGNRASFPTASGPLHPSTCFSTSLPPPPPPLPRALLEGC